METNVYQINKTDESGNHITGYEEVLTGTQKECVADYKHFHEYDGELDVEMLYEVEIKWEEKEVIIDDGNCHVVSYGFSHFDCDDAETIEDVIEAISDWMRS